MDARVRIEENIAQERVAWRDAAFHPFPVLLEDFGSRDSEAEFLASGVEVQNAVGNKPMVQGNDPATETGSV